MSFELHHGDCLEIMPRLVERFDILITDPPYNTKFFKYDDDSVMGIELLRAVVFCVQPMTTDFIAGNRKHFKYDLVWNKNFYKSNSFETRPGRKHETILIFGDLPYNPQITKRSHHEMQRLNRLQRQKYRYKQPGSVLDFDVVNNRNSNRTGHPCEKPLPLMLWLVKTYSSPGDVILDPFMGSGTTGVAAIRTGRHFVGIEKDAGYFKIAEQRIRSAQPALFTEDKSLLTPRETDLLRSGDAGEISQPSLFGEDGAG